jgi:hypothetical protein
MTMTLAEALLRQQERPNPCDPPVARMISLLTSNRPDMAGLVPSGDRAGSLIQTILWIANLFG